MIYIYIYIYIYIMCMEVRHFGSWVWKLPNSVWQLLAMHFHDFSFKMTIRTYWQLERATKRGGRIIYYILKGRLSVHIVIDNTGRRLVPKVWAWPQTRSKVWQRWKRKRGMSCHTANKGSTSSWLGLWISPVTIQATDSCQRSGHDHKLVGRGAGSSKLCNTEQACATQHFSCNRPQQASAAKTRSISTEAATHKNGVLGRQTCQAAWWTDLPSPCHNSPLIRRLSLN